MIRLRAAAATDAGRVRRSNQDMALVADGLVAVADGMGGHAGGEVAARMAVNALAKAFAGDRSSAGLVAATRTANGAIYSRSERHRELRGMGTTLTAAAVVRDPAGDRLAVVNVGDSRAYLATGEDLVRLTEDHSLVEELVRQGEMTEAEAAVHPHRHILTRALGIDPGVEVDSWTLEPPPGARLLLCSDGLTNECTDAEIARILRANPEPEAAARALVTRALDHGGSDNVTVVVADLVGDDEPPLASAVAPAAALAPEGAAASSRPGRTDRPAGSYGRLAGAAVGVPPPSSAARRPGGKVPTARAGGRPGPLLRRKRRRDDRVLTVWSALFVVALVAIVGGTVGFVEWYVRATYFVAFDGDRVAVYEGRPGGFLWFHPHLVQATALTRSRVFPPYLPLLRAGMVETSFAAARRVAGNLGNANAFLALPSDTAGSTAVSRPTTTSVPPTSTTTAPPTSTTTAPPTSTTAPTPTSTTTAPPPSTSTRAPARSTRGAIGTSGGTTAGTGASRTPPGASGAPGTRGASGTSGAPGTRGASGTSGATGTSAANGTSGATGTSGAPGTRGASGTSGVPATAGTSGPIPTQSTSGSTPGGG